MHEYQPTFLDCAVTGRGFFIDLLGDLESLREPASWSRHTDITLVLGLSRTLQKSTRHQFFADVACTRFFERRAVARIESLALLHE